MTDDELTWAAMTNPALAEALIRSRAKEAHMPVGEYLVWMPVLQFVALVVTAHQAGEL